MRYYAAWRYEVITLRHLRRIIQVLLVLIFVPTLALVSDYFLYPLVVSTPSANYNTGENGLWLGSKWYHGKVTDADITALAKLLQKEQIRFAYFHTRDINKEGKLRYHSEPAAKKFVSMLHELAPGVKVIAWIGAVNAVNGGDVNLAKPAVREEMAKEAANLVRTCGYDGIQWDFEPCVDGNVDYLSLLRETRAQLPQGALLSQAIPHFWSNEYIEVNSKLCDQMALMAYDMGVFGIFPRTYVWAVRQNALRISIDIAHGGTACKLIVGVPTYDEAPGHHVHAENIKLALIGVKQAPSDPACNRSAVAGVAPYAEWTTTADEWREYDRIWLGKTAE